uniref:POU domain, class 2, transcription factor 2 n=1 Tax=Schistocephalus solidus TaxID=70667 RepID=A0A0V0JAF0_SCHSO
MSSHLLDFSLIPFHDVHNEDFAQYITFMKDGIKINVPIRIPPDYRASAKNDPHFFEHLKSQIMHQFAGENAQKELLPYRGTPLNQDTIYALVHATTPRVLSTSECQETTISQPYSYLDDFYNVVSELRRVRAHYGLRQFDVATSINRCYGANITMTIISIAERAQLPLEDSLKLKPLFERWLKDMSTAEGRKLIFGSVDTDARPRARAQQRTL